ncbi:MAG: surface-adhesin E family protein [Pseudomonadota bacterium]
MSMVFAAESWRAFPTEAKNVLFSVDEASLVRGGDMVKFRERIVFIVPEKRDVPSGKKVKEKRIHRVMNCRDKTQAHLYASQIAEDGSRIEEVYRDENKLTMTPILPDTIGEQELQWACKGL